MDDSFDRWIEQLQEHAKIAGWEKEQQLYYTWRVQLEMYFRCFQKRRGMTLTKLLLPSQTDIEELRGLEFHHCMQGDKTIEQLGLSIQQLGRKAFPSVVGKEFDRLLKGRFYQALHIRWQRKLGSPKHDESFHELYVCARMFEQHEKQYSPSTHAQSEFTRKGERGWKYSKGPISYTDSARSRNRIRYCSTSGMRNWINPFRAPLSQV